MSKKVEFTGLIPVLSSQAGCCITAENWQAVGVNVAAYYLSALLMKPGYASLKTLPDLATYVGWSETLVLNASMPPVDAQGRYTLRSPYDGSRCHYTLDELIELIIVLRPEYVILPQGVSQYGNKAWQSLPDTIVPFFPLADRPAPSDQRAYGLYFYYDEQTLSLDGLKEQLTQNDNRPCYVGGDLSLPLLYELAHCGAQYLESDRPAHDACLGAIYSSEGNSLISDTPQAQQFEIIDKNCHCPTCSQPFTRAYLHHLFEHTPLLCQRLLIQHNVYLSREAVSNWTVDKTPI